MSMDLNRFTKVKLEEATKPKTGCFTYVDYYWLVTKDDEILFYNRFIRPGRRSKGSPQCNKDPRVGDMMIKKYGIEGLRNELIPTVYVEGVFG